MNIFQAYKINKEIKNCKNQPNCYKQESSRYLRDYENGRVVIELQTERYNIRAQQVNAISELIKYADDGMPYQDLYKKYTFAAHNQKTFAHIASRGMFARIFFNKLNSIVKE